MAINTIPDRGYCVGLTGRGNYTVCYPQGQGALKKAVRAARTLAERNREAVDVVQVQNRGSDRFIIDTIAPRSWKRR